MRNLFAWNARPWVVDGREIVAVVNGSNRIHYFTDADLPESFNRENLADLSADSITVEMLRELPEDRAALNSSIKEFYKRGGMQFLEGTHA